MHDDPTVTIPDAWRRTWRILTTFQGYALVLMLFYAVPSLAGEPASAAAVQEGQGAAAPELSAQATERLRNEIRAHFPDRKFEVIRREDGLNVLNIQGGLPNVVLVRQNSDGTTTQGCVNSPEPAVEFLTKPQTPAEDR